MRGKTLKTLGLLFLILIIQLNYIQIFPADMINDQHSNEIIIVSKIGGDYNNIQEAIKKANEGAIILIKNGFYSEIVEIDKAITLIGENKYTTKINPISNKNKYAIKIGAPDIVIKNLSINNGASGLYTSGIRVNAPRFEINNCNLYNNPIGIAIFSSNSIIKNCNFWNCKDEAIALIGTEISKCDNNIISNCNFFNNCDGIELQFSSDNKIQNCSFFNNTHSGIDAILSSNNENIIENCEIYNNEVNGIFLSNSSNNKIINCIFWGNKNGDIFITEDSINNLIIDAEFIESKIEYETLNLNNKENNLSINYENNIIATENFNKLIEMISNIIPILRNLF
jgi:parallel beta-helix repeat protein